MRAALFICLALSTATTLAADSVYKYVDSDGVIHYTDTPPTPTSKPARLPPLQTFGSPAPPARAPTAVASRATAAAESSRQVVILSPTPDQTFPRDVRAVPISVTLSRPLAEGHGLVYFIDGAPRNEPTQSLAFLIAGGMSQGAHIATVALMDSSGKELARSAPVMFHLKNAPAPTPLN